MVKKANVVSKDPYFSRANDDLDDSLGGHEKRPGFKEWDPKKERFFIVAKPEGKDFWSYIELNKDQETNQPEGPAMEFLPEPMQQRVSILQFIHVDEPVAGVGTRVLDYQCSTFLLIIPKSSFPEYFNKDGLAYGYTDDATGRNFADAPFRSSKKQTPEFTDLVKAAYK